MLLFIFAIVIGLSTAWSAVVPYKINGEMLIGSDYGGCCTDTKHMYCDKASGDGTCLSQASHCIGLNGTGSCDYVSQSSCNVDSDCVDQENEICRL